jgi:hypothetical protein
LCFQSQSGLEGRAVHGHRFLEWQVIGKADPGYKPLPEDLNWAAKVEYAKHYGLPHPAKWTRKLREEYDSLHPSGR